MPSQLHLPENEQGGQREQGGRDVQGGQDVQGDQDVLGGRDGPYQGEGKLTELQEEEVGHLVVQAAWVDLDVLAGGQEDNQVVGQLMEATAHQGMLLVDLQGPLSLYSIQLDPIPLLEASLGEQLFPYQLLL